MINAKRDGEIFNALSALRSIPNPDFDAGFIEGISWATSNPDWHEYPESPPPSSGEYIVVLGCGVMNILKYMEDNWFDEFGGDEWDVKLWMYKPKIK